VVKFSIAPPIPLTKLSSRGAGPQRRRTVWAGPLGINRPPVVLLTSCAPPSGIAPYSISGFTPALQTTNSLRTEQAPLNYLPTGIACSVPSSSSSSSAALHNSSGPHREQTLLNPLMVSVLVDQTGLPAALSASDTPSGIAVSVPSSSNSSSTGSALHNSNSPLTEQLPLHPLTVSVLVDQTALPTTVSASATPSGIPPSATSGFAPALQTTNSPCSEQTPLNPLTVSVLVDQTALPTILAHRHRAAASKIHQIASRSLRRGVFHSGIHRRFIPKGNTSSHAQGTHVTASASIHSEIHIAAASLHSDIHTTSPSVHSDIHTTSPSLHSGIHTASASVHSEIHTSSASLHSDIHTVAASLHSDSHSASLHSDIHTASGSLHSGIHTASATEAAWLNDGAPVASFPSLFRAVYLLVGGSVPAKTSAAAAQLMVAFSARLPDLEWVIVHMIGTVSTPLLDDEEEV